MFKPPPAPPNDTHVLVEQYWVESGDAARGDPEASGRYVVTPGTRRRLGALARAATLRRHPILLQGPTSSGKTSLVEYLAEKTGHRFVRINNHEHTDLQEYLGSYITDENGACFDEKNAPRRKNPHERMDVFFPSFSSREPSLPRGRVASPVHILPATGVRSLLIRPNTVGGHRAGRAPERKPRRGHGEARGTRATPA